MNTGAERDRVVLFLGGDTMTARAVDQILPHPGDPRLEESFVRDARSYIALAEAANGAVRAPVDFAYVWGDALAQLQQAAPDARIVNLETSVTSSGRFWPEKGIHYRMNPQNVPCLSAAGIEVCSLANNHVMDFGREGLVETLQTLQQAGIQAVGAGRNATEAWRPVTLTLQGGVGVQVFAFGSEDSGIPPQWAARDDQSGVSLLSDLSDAAAAEVAARIAPAKRGGAIVVASIHWGSNWGYEVPPEHIRFAHRLIEAGVDLVHGHSSHHPRPIEVHRGRLILYGCGDLINDYEGITGYEQFRDDLVLLYLVSLDPPTGALTALRMIPMRIRNLRLNRPSDDDVRWLAGRLDTVSRRFGAHLAVAEPGQIALVHQQ